jgi:hypothetical protein
MFRAQILLIAVLFGAQSPFVQASGHNSFFKGDVVHIKLRSADHVALIKEVYADGTLRVEYLREGSQRQWFLPADRASPSLKCSAGLCIYDKVQLLDAPSKFGLIDRIFANGRVHVKYEQDGRYHSYWTHHSKVVKLGDQP